MTRAASLCALLVIFVAGCASPGTPSAATPDSTMSASPTITAAPTATATTSPQPTPEPTTAVDFAALTITSHRNGETATEPEIEVRGMAPAGDRVVQDISFAPDQDVIASVDGSWMLPIDLDEGANELTFRLDDDEATAIQLSLTYAPTVAATPVAPDPTPQPTTADAPEDWVLFVCGAVQQIDDSGNHVAALGEAATDFDVALIIEEGNKATKDAREARDMLGFAPAWAEGAAVVVALDTTATKTIQAINLIILGAESLDSATIEEGVALLNEAVEAKFEAAMLLVELEQATGVSCY